MASVTDGVDAIRPLLCHATERPEAHTRPDSWLARQFGIGRAADGRLPQSLAEVLSPRAVRCGRVLNISRDTGELLFVLVRARAACRTYEIRQHCSWKRAAKHGFALDEQYDPLGMDVHISGKEQRP